MLSPHRRGARAAGRFCWARPARADAVLARVGNVAPRPVVLRLPVMAEGAKAVLVRQPGALAAQPRRRLGPRRIQLGGTGDAYGPRGRPGFRDGAVRVVLLINPYFLVVQRFF